MRRLLPLAVCLVLASCATAWHAPMPRPNDTLRVGAEPAPARKIKAGTVIYQLGAGNVATAADNRKAGQRQGSAATAPAAQASNASRRTAGDPPWYVYALAGAVLIAAWEWLSHQLPPGWLRWRAR